MDTSDIKKGLKLMMDGNPYVVTDFQFVKPGKGQAFTRTKMRNMLSGNTIERNIRSGERFEPADVEDRTLQYIYQEGEMYVFMHSKTGDQVSVHQDIVGDDAGFLLDGVDVTITIYNGNPVSIELPPHIVAQIIETEPGVRGDTANNVTKPATISTGAIVNVPIFVTEKEWIKIDTRTRNYLERAKAPSTAPR
jgi:elongation factor P